MRHLLPGQWLAIGTMTTAGASVKWCCEELLHCSVEEFNAWAEAAPAGGDGLVYLPYLLGERTPHWDAAAKGVIWGFRLDTGREALCRAVLEGVACGWRQIMEHLEADLDFRPSRLVCSGGGSRSRLWNQIKATLLQRPLEILHYNEMSSLGACLQAGLGVGVFHDADDAFQSVSPLMTRETVEPVAAWSQPLEALYHRYVELYPRVKGL
jgi:xylulokinase